MTYDFDLLAIGCGPAGQRAVIQSAKLGKRAAVVERRQVGGVCVMSGTIPSKTLREAVIYLTGLSQRGIYGQSYRLKEDITMDDLRGRGRPPSSSTNGRCSTRTAWWTWNASPGRWWWWGAG